MTSIHAFSNLPLYDTETHKTSVGYTFELSFCLTITHFGITQYKKCVISFLSMKIGYIVPETGGRCFTCQNDGKSLFCMLMSSKFMAEKGNLTI